MSNCTCSFECAGIGTTLMVLMLLLRGCGTDTAIEKISKGETVIKCNVVEQE